MSTKSFDERITTRYGKREKNIYEQVIDLVKKNNIAKSRAQLILVERGLQHTHNPEPIIKTVVKEVPVEKIVKEIVYRDPPKVDKSTSQKHLGQEHVGIEDHITEEHITGDLQNARQRPSADKLSTLDKADPPSSSSIALKEKKSASEENGISGWKIAGGLGIAGVIGYIAYRIWNVYH